MLRCSKMATFLFKFAISLFFMHSIGYSVQGCEDGDVRFDPERDSVVQVCLGDQWGYICARDYPLDRWTTTDNNIFCQQMGLLGINYTADNDCSSFVTNSSIDDGTISFQTVFCIGTEKRLIDCPHDDFVGNNKNACMRGDVHYYARAACSETNVTCIAGSVQVEESGLLNICTEGEWHTLCANNVTWTDSNAKSVCRELGHNPNGASPVLNNANSSMEDRANISFHCRGGEGMLSACTGTITDCTNINTIAGVKCGVTSVPVFNLTVTEIIQSSVKLSWESVSAYEDSDHHYTINCTDNVTTLIQNVNGDVNENVIPNLSSGQNYTCCVYNVTNNDGVSRGTCLSFVTLSSEPTENTSASGDSDFIYTSVVPWIGGIVIGAVVAVIIMSVIFFTLRLVQQRKQGNLNDSAYNDNPDGSANEINQMERPHLQSNASEGKTVINTLYDASLSLSASYVPTHDHTYSSLNELPPSD